MHNLLHFFIIYLQVCLSTPGDGIWRPWSRGKTTGLCTLGLVCLRITTCHIIHWSQFTWRWPFIYVYILLICQHSSYLFSPLYLIKGIYADFFHLILTRSWVKYWHIETGKWKPWEPWPAQDTVGEWDHHGAN